MTKEIFKKIEELVRKETENKEFRQFALLPEKYELTNGELGIEEATKVIKKYNDLIFVAHSQYINDTFEW